MSDKQNPASFKIEYGRSVIILAATDNVTGEVQADTLTIRHTPIPKKANISSSSKYALDLKDIPQDVGGGVISEYESPGHKFLLSLVVLLTMSLSVFLFMRAYK